MAESTVSSSEETITADQAAKFTDLLARRLLESGLPSDATQYVHQNEGEAVADAFVADIRHRVEVHLRAIEPHILERRSFDPEQFLGRSWKIHEQVGTRTGSLDAGQIVLKCYLYEGEAPINSQERLKRIKEVPEDIQLDAEDFMALWQEEGHVTLKWLYDTKGITWLSFWGTILCDELLDRYVLFFMRRDDGSWNWRCHSVKNGIDFVGPPAAVLASN